MPLESAAYISELIATNPDGQDPLGSSDDHIRMVKNVLQNSFPNVSGAVTPTQTEFNQLTGLTSNVQQQLDNILTTIQDNIYPVGSIYTNAVSDVNPATLLGFGIWVEFGAGRVLVGQNLSDTSFNTLEGEGGSKNAVLVEHTHTISNAGEHTHTYRDSRYSYASGSWTTDADDNFYQSDRIRDTDPAGDHTHSISTEGELGVDKNLQPYIVVKMWKRVA